MAPRSDADWLDAAAALAGRARPLSRPNPGVGAIVVAKGRVIARGWTHAGGRPHAEAVALAAAGEAARGATLYVTLEPCAHRSLRGPSCTSLVIASGIARAVVGCEDPDPRTAGTGIAALREAGITVEVLPRAAARASLVGYLMRASAGRPHLTLKLATSLDGCIALADGTSKWITGPEARAHAHLERACADAILVGGGTLRADSPMLDVRLAGLEHRSPRRFVLTRGNVPEGWAAVSDLKAPAAFGDAQYLMVEGGAGAGAAFLRADLVDRLLLYRAPIVIGGGRPSVGDIGLTSLDPAHGLWRMTQTRRLGSDHLEVYERTR
ncbi:bifunctional diaminohydroxyphosphoribosylaminopyrimidine deaminase/5-amino-6-(5-phosphoribosylamino)uracil reductase RibD [Novosphingobium sp.]|uniref:bifunctional diaminohydroxyphosphoribosylaminopyrimidine deaminase/5-amino-6-(5-phosphoribosylamino)uracil reductase RibD n=1 Tax=Novosphingobium sp. TaxID=1874826 RepID=UPI0025F1FEF8|nr:bifunctional diaminohydroxyphosphoribosylaminopyrimidine deaminase/5-amino-6-(5-phosphoribosylamino)uracil reductase RibD [Novosphingobium sp.]